MKTTTAQINKVKEKLAKVGIKLISDSEWNVFRIYPVGDKDSTYETNGRTEEDLQDALGSGLDLAKTLKRNNPKPKSKKKVKKVTKKKSTKKTKKVSKTKTKRIVVTGKRPTYRRIAGENAAGGFGAGFGIGAGHAFGDWLFD